MLTGFIAGCMTPILAQSSSLKSLIRHVCKEDSTSHTYEHMQPETLRDHLKQQNEKLKELKKNVKKIQGELWLPHIMASLAIGCILGAWLSGNTLLLCALLVCITFVLLSCDNQFTNIFSTMLESWEKRKEVRLTEDRIQQIKAQLPEEPFPNIHRIPHA